MKAQQDARQVPVLLPVADYLALIKFRLLSLVLVSVCMGFYISAPRSASITPLLFTLLGIALVGGGANTLNQWKERRADALMLRTRLRPLPSGRVTPMAALVFGLLISLTGFLLIGLSVNLATLVLAFLSWASYLFVYTPMKTRSVANTWVGAVPGALPAVLGSTAAGAGLDAGSLMLFAILYLWQMPHFFAISWVYRDDYLRGGFRMLSWDDTDGRRSARQILLHTLLLLPVGTGLYFTGTSGLAYLLLSLAAGLVFLYLAIRFLRCPGKPEARRVFHFSILYLPLLFGGILLDRVLGA